ANHNDANVKNTQTSKSPVLSVAVFNCQCNNLVVVSPFTLQIQPIVTAIPELLFVNSPAREFPFHSIDHFFFELRGPPSFA
ncbi:MAG: hypothetical protein ABI419_07965, partial [Ginsengibacter sp.]